MLIRQTPRRPGPIPIVEVVMLGAGFLAVLLAVVASAA